MEHKVELFNHCCVSRNKVALQWTRWSDFCVLVIQPERAEIPNLHTICECTAEEEVVWIRCLCAEHGALQNMQSKSKWRVSTCFAERGCKSPPLPMFSVGTLFLFLHILFYEMLLWLLFLVVFHLELRIKMTPKTSKAHEGSNNGNCCNLSFRLLCAAWRLALAQQTDFPLHIYT